MEYAIFKEKMISASEIAEDFGIETSIRIASRNKELQCPDPECKQPLIKYCHGDVKDAYFAHVNHGACDYASFDKETTPTVRFIQQTLYEHFKGLGYNVDQEIKILPHHYTHLVITFDDGDRLALEIGTQQITKNAADNLSRKYQEQEIPFRWIIIGEPSERVQEGHVCFIKRQQLNESENGDLFLINEKGTAVAQCRLFNEPYIYKERCMDKVVAQGVSGVEKLKFMRKELAIPKFVNQLPDWYEKKQDKFRESVDKEIEAIELNRRLAEQDAMRLAQRHEAARTQYQEPKMVSISNSYEQRKQEIMPLMEQNEHQVWDSKNFRWIKCIQCGAIAAEDFFPDYGGRLGPARGICRDCIRNRYKRY